MDLQAVGNGTRLASFLVEPNFDCVTITEPESDKDTCSITHLVHIDLQRRYYRAICANLEDAGDYLKLLGYLDSQMYNMEKSTLSLLYSCCHLFTLTETSVQLEKTNQQVQKSAHSRSKS